MWLWDNPRSGQIRLFVCLAMLGGAFAAGYHQVFSTLAPYDDEGYVMMSVSQYLQGRPLYDDVFTQYGPAYYTIQAAMHQGLGLTVNHDVTRLTTLAIWLIVSSCGAWCVYRMTTSPLVAMSGFGCVFFHLDKLCLEPGHPQELIALCLVGVVSAGLCLDDRRTIWRCVGWGWLGILLSVALLTKLNIGLFLGLGIFCFVARRMPDELWRRRLLVVGVGAGSILAFGLYRRALMDLSVLALPVVTASSLFVVCRTRFLHVPVADETSQNGGNAGLADSNSVTPGSAATWRAQEVAVLLAAALGTALLILAIQLGRGTSPAGL